MFWVIRVSQSSMHPSRLHYPRQSRIKCIPTSHIADELASVSVPKWKDGKVPAQLGQIERTVEQGTDVWNNRRCNKSRNQVIRREEVRTEPPCTASHTSPQTLLNAHYNMQPYRVFVYCYYVSVCTIQLRRLPAADWLGFCHFHNGNHLLSFSFQYLVKTLHTMDTIWWTQKYY
jgi:hypothetical protein